MSKAVCFVAALLIAAAAPAAAQQTVQERLAVMDAQLELLKKQGSLDKALQESAGSSWAALPQVLAVMGLDGVMSARLQLPNGVVNIYRVGEPVRPGMTVASISPRQVSVAVGGAKGARSVLLEFVAGGPAPGQAGFAPLPGGRPPVPRELLPEPPVVRLPTAAMPAVVAPAAAPSASPPGAAGAAAVLPAAAVGVQPIALKR